ncbi:DNA mismatch repair protein [Knufia fluminis]|uniref:DNA mismatch repair protein n=1 Tax=Knufia fluminis TaxID=191047 RepID=A0AAN8IIK5_9EURO|nr:DNA mismatch repair protein [Knufia fluminis]
MTLIDNRIYPLDNISQARIKSAVQILSLSDVILELVKNALDAQASSIKVVLNYAHGFCSVLDNGHGIPANEFSEHGRLARAYCTSKAGREGFTYGRDGRYLAALSGVSLLSITSRTASDDSAHVLWMDESGRLGHTKEPPDSSEVTRGTRVKVHNLFSKLPVRYKHLVDRFADSIEVHKEFDRLKHTLTGLILAFPRPFELYVKHSSSAHIFHHKLPPNHVARMADSNDLASVEAVATALYHAGYIDKASAPDWRHTTIASGSITIHAVLSLEPMPHKLVQFMAINHQPLTKQNHPEPFQVINTLFDSSSFGAVDHGLDSSPSQWQGSKRPGRRLRLDSNKGVDRWPMFVVWVSTHLETTDGLLRAIGASTQKQQLMERIISLIRTLVREFLISHDFLQPRQERAGRVDLTDPGDTAADRRQLDAFPSKQSFRYWSRVKSSRAAAVDDILAGLPFHKSKPDSQEAFLGSGSRSRPTSTDSDDTVVADEPEAVPTTIEPVAGSPEPALEWTDPQTGRTVRIDPRTGMVLPDATTLTKASTSTTPRTPHGVANCSLPRGGRKKTRALPLEQVVRNVRRYSTGWPTNHDQPLKSIALFNELGESVEEQARTRKKQIDEFWKSAGHCRAPAVQLEMPRISKKVLPHARVLRQLDNKFILALMPTFHCRTKGNGKLVLIDQHAADERCKVEGLLRSLYEDEAVMLASSLIFEIAPTEIQMLGTLKQHFAQWNILYEVAVDAGGEKVADEAQEVAVHAQHVVRVTGLPSVIAERCRINPKLIIELLREEIWSDNSVRQPKPSSSGMHNHKRRKLTSDMDLLNQQPMCITSNVPPRLLELINSRACRSAIMFNDELDMNQCETLIGQLSKCTLPFQCAHGRPSMVVLSDLDSFSDHKPLAFDLAATHLANTESIFDHDKAVVLAETSSAATWPRGTSKGGEANSGRSAGQSSNSTASLFAPPQGQSTLNTIDDCANTFGQTYRAWVGLDHTSAETPMLL